MSTLELLAHALLMQLLAAVAGLGALEWLLMAALLGLLLVLGVLLWVSPS